ncbi:hypothetical protein COOONC_11634, partial [Cooperia oncophora]
LEGTPSPVKKPDVASEKVEPTQKSSSVRSINDAEAMEKESTGEIFRQTLIPFLVGGFGSTLCGLLVNRIQKTELVCNVPHMIAIFVPLQGMKGNLDMTFTSRLGTMVRNAVFLVFRKSPCNHPFPIKVRADLQGQGIFISLFAVLMSFVLASLYEEGKSHPPVDDYLFLGANSLFSICIANATSAVGDFSKIFELKAIQQRSDPSLPKKAWQEVLRLLDVLTPTNLIFSDFISIMRPKATYHELITTFWCKGFDRAIAESDRALTERKRGCGFSEQFTLNAQRRCGFSEQFTLTNQHILFAFSAMVLLVIYTYHKALNPDNIGTPIAASFSDLLTILTMVRYYSTAYAAINTFQYYCHHLSTKNYL